MKNIGLIVSCCLVLGLPTFGFAQAGRYEVGLRLHAFETAWDQHNNAEARKRSVAPLKTAVNSFFAGRFEEIARSFDQARHALVSDKAPDPALVQLICSACSSTAISSKPMVAIYRSNCVRFTRRTRNCRRMRTVWP